MSPGIPKDRVVVIDVIAGVVVGIVAAAFVAAVVIAITGWDVLTPSGVGGHLGRALSEAATGQPISATPVPFTATVGFQVPFWAGLVGVPLGIAHLRGRNLIEDFGLRFRWIDAPVGIVAGLIGQLALVPLVYLPFLSLIDEDKIDDPARALGHSATSVAGGAIALVFMVVVAAPLAEEIAYRGGMMMAMRERFGPVVGIIGSAVIFGLTHFQLLQLPALIAIGLVTGYLAHRFDRIGPAVWAHVAFNGVAAAALLL